MSAYSEQGAVFSCGDSRLVGIATIPEEALDIGVLILVGGPQYRVGSHRQFTLLARRLAREGIPSLRFDSSGRGDSEGERHEFDQAEQDLSAAVEAFFRMSPGLSRVILWGLCDAASAAMMFAHREPRVGGMILLNPWVHSAGYSPEVMLSHYYRPLLVEKDYWRRLASGKIKVFPALLGAAKSTLLFIRRRTHNLFRRPLRQSSVQRMLEGVTRFRHGMLVILSEEDLTAREFSNLVDNDKDWRAALSKPGITTHTVVGADHTFSKKPWQEEVSQVTVDWAKRQ